MNIHEHIKIGTGLPPTQALEVVGNILIPNDNNLFFADTTKQIGGVTSWNQGGSPIGDDGLLFYNEVGSNYHYVNGNSNSAAHWFQSVKTGQGTIKTDFMIHNSGSVQIGHVYNDGYSNTNLLDVISPAAFSVAQRFSIGFDSQIYMNIDPGSTVGGGNQHLRGVTYLYGIASNPTIIDLNPSNSAASFGWIWDPVGTAPGIYSLMNIDSSARHFSFDVYSGNMGIGTGNLAAPAARLHAIASTLNGSTYNIVVQDSGGNDLFISASDGYAIFRGNGSSNSGLLNVYGGDLLAPSNLFTVTTHNGNEVFNIIDTLGGGGAKINSKFGFWSLSPTVDAAISGTRLYISGVGNNSSSDALEVANSDDDLILVVRNSKNVGINVVPDASAALHVAGVTRLDSYITFGANYPSSQGLITYSGGSYFEILSGTGLDLHLGVDLNANIKIYTSTGNVGTSANLSIGDFTQHNSDRLYIISTSTNAIKVQDSSQVVDLLTLNNAGILDLASTTGALLVPRMNSTQETDLTPVNGMIIYNNQTNKFRGYENGAWADLI